MSRQKNKKKQGAYKTGEREQKTSRIKIFFDTLSNKATRWTGSPSAFIIAFAAVILWAGTGPLFHYSDTWQLVINTSTTIITFLMVFLIQQSQNKDTVALHLKLDELLAANTSTSNRLVDVEDLNEDELEKLKAFYKALRGNIGKEKEIHETHSIDEQKVITKTEAVNKEVATEVKEETELKEIETERDNKPVTKKRTPKKIVGKRRI